MKTESREQKLIEIFQSEKVLGLEMVKEIIGTTSRMTVFRQLKAIGYHGSYSHAGKYYTLWSIPVFDRNGLWSYCGIHFSRYGNLMETIPVLVNRSEAGYFASELQELLKVFVHNAVGKLFKLGRLLREQIGDQYLYLSAVRAERQFVARKGILTKGTAQSAARMDSGGQDIIEYFETFFSVLNEKQRRLCLGLESIRFGHGGDARIALIAGVNVKTVSRGRRELLSKEIDLDRIRRKGAGRPALKKTKS
jgi:hypothetical protein